MSKKYIFILAVFVVLAAQPLSGILANFYSYEKTTEAVLSEAEQVQSPASVNASTAAPAVEKPVAAQSKPDNISQVPIDQQQGQNNSNAVALTSPTQNGQPTATKLPTQQNMSSWNSQNPGRYYPSYGQMGSEHQTDYEWYKCNDDWQMGQRNWR